MKKQICKCDVCQTSGEINFNYGQPNDWIEATFSCNMIKGDKVLNFCSKECLVKFIENESLGNLLNHRFKDLSSTKNEVNSPQAKPLNLSDEDGRERPLVADKRERDKFGDIHSQNKEFLDKDYASDKLNATESK